PGFRSRPDLSRGAYEAHELVWSRYSIESLFLDVACLTAWLLAVLPAGTVPEATLRPLVDAALKHADGDLDLLLAAIWRMSVSLMRKDELKLDDAQKAAEAKVRAEPDIWQHGRDRARHVLGGVRAALPDNATRNPVRTGLLDLVRAAAVDKLGDPLVLIPAEIRSLLDYMASPAVGAPARP
ncbi:MAG TPA: hypothetical protein VEU33_08040, partial [Archangium sp.]|nr:hypothetical protein [Archangium sp.]